MSTTMMFREAMETPPTFTATGVWDPLLQAASGHTNYKWGGNSLGRNEIGLPSCGSGQQARDGLPGSHRSR
jgi:hypothetical protein